jgi:hypothetical protein
METLSKKQRTILKMLVDGYKLQKYFQETNNENRVRLDAFLMAFVADLTITDQKAVIPAFLKKTERI